MRTVFRRVGKENFFLLLLCMVFTVLEVHYDLKIPDVMSDMTMYVQEGNNNMAEIYRAGGKMLIYTAISLINVIISSVILAKFTSDFSAKLRKDLFYKSQDLSQNEINRFSVSSLITRATNDLVNIESAIVLGLLVIFKAPLMAGMAINKIRSQDRQWSLLTAAVVIFIIIMSLIALFLIYKKFISIQLLTDNVNNVARENMKGVYTIRAFNFERKRSERFFEKNFELTKTEQYTDSIVAVANVTITVVLNITTVLIYLLGASTINNAEGEKKLILFSDMLVYSTYAMQIINSLVMMMVIFIFLPKAIVSVKRIAEVLETESSIIDGSESIEGGIETIEFRNVFMAYPGAKENVLTDINFSVNKGETLAVTGPTGSGKTTLIKALMRLYDTSNGQILINGQDIKEYSLKEMYSNIGYVPQNNILFKGTAASNIAYGLQEIDDDMLNKACSTSDVNSFLEDSAKVSESGVLGEGSNYSGGQKQRLSIARALYKEPSVLIMDDSFSALDFKTDKNIRTKLKKEYKDAIKIIISQRISTIIDADNILVLDDGKIVGSGKHEDLMRKCVQYREFADVQLNGGTSDE